MRLWIWTPQTHCLSHQYFVRSASHAWVVNNPVSTMLNFGTWNFQATVISTSIVKRHWKLTYSMKMCWNNMWSSMKFIWAVLNYTLIKVLPSFYHPIHVGLFLLLYACAPMHAPVYMPIFICVCIINGLYICTCTMCLCLWIFIYVKVQEHVYNSPLFMRLYIHTPGLYPSTSLC